MLQSSSHMARVQDLLANEGWDWKFIPPHGPYFRELREAAVKSMKYRLRRTLGSHVATYEELCILLAEIEACLNSRPLCALSDEFFQPNIFVSWTFSNWWTTYLLLTILMSNATDFPGGKPTNNNYNSSGNDGHPTTSSLQQRQCWQRTSPNLQPGDLVLLREDNMTPLHWSTAVIKGTHPRKDGIVQVVTVRTPKGILKCTTTKICPVLRINSEL